MLCSTAVRQTHCQTKSLSDYSTLQKYIVPKISFFTGNNLVWKRFHTIFYRPFGMIWLTDVSELQMRISYNKLQKLMIDNQMKRQDLMRAAEISSSVATKLNKNETVSLDVLMRICKVFHCDIGD